MIIERIRFELQVIYDRLKEIKIDYESKKSIRQEHIVDIVYKKDLKNPTIVIHMNTFAYSIKYNDDENKYKISWYRKLEDDKYVKDGSSYSDDLSSTVRDIDAYLYSGFCPARASWWVAHSQPKHYTKNKRWA